MTRTRIRPGTKEIARDYLLSILLELAALGMLMGFCALVFTKGG